MTNIITAVNNLSGLYWGSLGGTTLSRETRSGTILTAAALWGGGVSLGGWSWSQQGYHEWLHSSPHRSSARSCQDPMGLRSILDCKIYRGSPADWSGCQRGNRSAHPRRVEAPHGPRPQASRHPGPRYRADNQTISSRGRGGRTVISISISIISSSSTTHCGRAEIWRRSERGFGQLWRGEDWR